MPDVHPLVVRETWDRFCLWRDAFGETIRRDQIFRLFAKTHIQKLLRYGLL